MTAPIPDDTLEKWLARTSPTSPLAAVIAAYRESVATVGLLREDLRTAHANEQAACRGEQSALRQMDRSADALAALRAEIRDVVRGMRRGHEAWVARDRLISLLSTSTDRADGKAL